MVMHSGAIAALVAALVAPLLARLAPFLAHLAALLALDTRLLRGLRFTHARALLLLHLRPRTGLRLRTNLRLRARRGGFGHAGALLLTDLRLR